MNLSILKKKTVPSFKELVAKEQIFAPCIWDCRTARAAELAGFKAALLSGGQLAESVVGLPDIGMITADDLVQSTERICNYSSLPIIIDADDGFGETPLTRYRRHVLMLHPRTVLIYDELEASEPVRWDWLLHSPVRFDINEAEQVLSTADEADGFYAVTQLFGSSEMDITQTDQFAVPPATGGAEYPNQWHLTACTDNQPATRYLTLIQVCEAGESPYIIRRDGDTFTWGDLTVEACLNASESPRLVVRHHTEPVVFSYGEESPVIDGVPYLRQEASSSLLYDETDGEYQVMEMTDRAPIATRKGF